MKNRDWPKSATGDNGWQLCGRKIGASAQLLRINSGVAAWLRRIRSVDIGWSAH